MSKDPGRSAYMQVICVSSDAVGALPPKTLALAAAYAKTTGRPIYDMSQFTGASKTAAASFKPKTSPALGKK